MTRCRAEGDLPLPVRLRDGEQREHLTQATPFTVLGEKEHRPQHIMRCIRWGDTRFNCVSSFGFASFVPVFTVSEGTMKSPLALVFFLVVLPLARGADVAFDADADPAYASGWINGTNAATDSARG